MRYVLVFGLLLLSVSAVAEPYFPKVSEYNLEVSFEPDAASLRGRAAILFSPKDFPIDTAKCYFHGEFRAKSVTAAGRDIPTSQSLILYPYTSANVAREITMDLTGVGPTDTLIIEYAGPYHLSESGAPSNYMRIDEEGVFFRSYGYSLWFPTFLPSQVDDYEVDFPRVSLDLPEKFVPVFTGEIISDDVTDGRRTTIWSAKDVSLFNAQCTARPFEVVSEGNIHVYHLRDSVSRSGADQILAFAGQLEQIYRQLYRSDVGSEPLYVVQLCKFGDIGSGNMIGIQDPVWFDFENAEYPKETLAHELVHAHARTDIQRSNPLYSLIIEGFPSYAHLPGMAEMMGEDWLDKEMKETEVRYLKFKKTGRTSRGRALPPEKPIDQITPDEISEYKDVFILEDRAPLFLHYLRGKAGKEKFALFCKSIFDGSLLTDEEFREKASEMCNVPREDVDMWLSTNEFPERFRLTD